MQPPLPPPSSSSSSSSSSYYARADARAAAAAVADAAAFCLLAFLQAGHCSAAALFRGRHRQHTTRHRQPRRSRLLAPMESHRVPRILQHDVREISTPPSQPPIVNKYQTNNNKKLSTAICTIVTICRFAPGCLLFWRSARVLRCCGAAVLLRVFLVSSLAGGGPYGS